MGVKITVSVFFLFLYRLVLRVPMLVVILQRFFRKGERVKALCEFENASTVGLQALEDRHKALLKKQTVGHNKISRAHQRDLFR
jgi:hypothetical protein